MRKLTHEEIAGRFPPPDGGEGGRYPVHLLLDNIRSLYNVGSIFRSADGARAAGLWLTGFTPRPPRKEITKTALGAEGSVPWRYFRNPADAAAELRRLGVRLLLLEHTDASAPYTSLRPADFPLCLVVGNEITGVSRELVALADGAVEIPMYGVKHSLNAAVAAGVALYECVRVLAAGEAVSGRR